MTKEQSSSSPWSVRDSVLMCSGFPSSKKSWMFWMTENLDDRQLSAFSHFSFLCNCSILALRKCSATVCGVPTESTNFPQSEGSLSTCVESGVIGRPQEHYRDGQKPNGAVTSLGCEIVASSRDYDLATLLCRDDTVSQYNTELSQFIA